MFIVTEYAALMKVIMKCLNIKLWDILGCFLLHIESPSYVLYYLIRSDLTTFQKRRGRHRHQL